MMRRAAAFLAASTRTVLGKSRSRRTNIAVENKTGTLTKRLVKTRDGGQLELSTNNKPAATQGGRRTTS